MDADRWRRLEPLLDAVLALPAGERWPFVERVAADQPELAEPLARLVAADADAGSFLDRPAAEAALATDPRHPAGPRPAPRPGLRPGDRLGAYRLVRPLQRGGMGTVFLARRDDREFQREVAIKLLRDDLGNEEARQRLIVERQMLARLEHRHVARLYDGGTTPQGRPYLVMEYIDGLPLDRYCARHRLAIDRRLDLFRTVCSAVHFAHQNLLVHRDLKPSNILVTRDGTPKLLDFGIAKPLAPVDGAEAAVTRTGWRPMTPGYASPEQILGRAVTTATDVHALGILLYELLTGCRPFAVRGRPLHRVEQAICEAVPPPPSEAAGRCEEIRVGGGASADDPGEDLPLRPPGRPRELRRRLAGDLDNVVLKALAKDPGERYTSAEQLSDDLGRHLAGQPVRARPATVAYRLGRFLRRHRAIAAVAVFAALTIGGYVGAVRRQAERFEQERDKVQRTLDFLVELFEVSRPDRRIGSGVRARQLLDLGARRIAHELDDRPDVQATIHDTVGRIYTHLGLFEPAREHVENGLALRRAQHGSTHAEVAASLHNLAVVASGLGAPERGRALFEQALALRRTLLGERHPAVAETLSGLAEVMADEQDFEGAEALFREALAIRRQAFPPPHRRIADSLGKLAGLLVLEGDLEAAEPLAREALAMRRKIFGDGHPDLGASLRDLAQISHRLGKSDAAEKLFLEALDLYRELLGEDHPAVVDSLSDLGWHFGDRGDERRSESYCRQALDVARRLYPGDHPDVATLLSDLAISRGRQGDLQEAEALFDEAYDMAARIFGEGHPRLAQFHYSRAVILHENGDLETAEPLYRLAMERVAEGLSRQHPAFAYPQAGLGALLVDRGEPAAGEALLRGALEILRSTHRPDHWRLAWAENDLGHSLVLQGRAEAEPLLRHSNAVLRAWLHPDDSRRRRATARLAALDHTSGPQDGTEPP